MPDKIKGRFTFRTAAVLIFLSGIGELFSITSKVLLFGNVHGGIAAFFYHLAYGALYAALGAGLWYAKKWGYPLVLIVTAVYTLDKLQTVLSIDAAAKWMLSQLSAYGAGGLIDEGLLAKAILLMTVSVVAGWLGFAGYAWWRRDYFRNR